MLIIENRASAILVNFLKSNKFTNPFLLPANVCPVVPLAFIKANVPFEFIDIDESHAMNQEICKSKLSRKYSGLLFVHAYGRQFDTSELYSFAKSLNLCIIDDCCLCFPKIDDDLSSVSLKLYSTGYAKCIELGYGGIGVVNSDYLYNHHTWDYDEETEKQQALYIKDCFNNQLSYEWGDVSWCDSSPYNGTIDEYIDKINKSFEDIYQSKQIINNIYSSKLPREIQWGSEYNNWRFMVDVPNRNFLLYEIFKAGLFAGTNFPSVVYLFNKIKAEKAEQEASRVINLFNDFRVNEEFAIKVCDVINRVL